MTLKEKLSTLNGSYCIVNSKGIISINGNFGSKQSDEYMDKEVIKTYMIEGLYDNVTRITISD